MENNLPPDLGPIDPELALDPLDPSNSIVEVVEGE